MSSSVSSDRVVVGMSGGVDSSVAALLLKRQGFDVHGLFMSNWEEDEEGYCTAAADFQDARSVCEELAIPLHRVSFAGEYRARVFKYFLDEYRAGRTPNPDVLCNREIKFGVFKEYAGRLGAARIATGHYARVRDDGEIRQLLRARDTAKDQTYFLSAVDQRGLSGSLFPLGDLRKDEVRDMAREAGLAVFGKKDSTGICFIGERDFGEFLGRFLPARPGEIRALDGRRLGEHRGLMFYTLGQRQGLQIGGVKGASEAPWYVVEKDMQENVLLVAQGHAHPRLFSDRLQVADMNWIAGQPPAREFVCTARLRYRQADQSCAVTVAEGGQLEVAFDRPQRAVTPGQFAVLYQGEVCLGGGVIAHTRRASGTSTSNSGFAPPSGSIAERSV